jgi:class 3 adenylate cyclase
MAGLERLGRVVLVERRGIGASDPLDFESDVFGEWTADVVAVLDALGVETATIVGYASSARLALEIAVREPERVGAIVGLHAGVPLADATGATPADGQRVHDLRSQLRAVVERDAEAADAMAATTTPSRLHDRAYQEWFARGGRLGASPLTATKFWEAVLADPAALVERLGAIRCPVLLLHRAEQALLPPVLSEQLVARIPGAALVVLAGGDVSPNAGDVDALVAEIARFVTGEHRVPAADRRLVGLLFTDLVQATARMSASGDSSWRRVLDEHDSIGRQTVGRHGGTVVKTTGDGVLATFDNASRALECASALRAALQDLGLAVRMGIHAGEVEGRGDDVAGIAVHLAARVMAEAGPDEILVSASVPIVSAGGAFRFEPVGARALKGLPGEWELFRLQP